MKIHLITYVYREDLNRLFESNYWKHIDANYHCWDNLHPDLAVKKLIESINTGQKEITLVTVHSDLINAIGHLILKGKLNKNEVEFTLINYSHEIRYPYYDNEGTLHNWYYGFYEWMDDEFERL